MELKVLSEFSPFGEHILKERQKSFLNKSSVISKQESSSSSECPFDSVYNEISNEDIYKIYEKGKYHLNSPSEISNENEDFQLKITYDEELYIFGSKVIWSQGNVLKRSYSFDNYNQQVTQAFWAYFYIEDLEKSSSINGKENKVLKKTLCIFLETFAKFYLNNGQSFTLNLPFKIKKAFPLDHGIIIQRIPEKEEFSTNSDSQISNLNISILFSVMHPLEEMRIVSMYKTQIQTGQEDILNNKNNDNIIPFSMLQEDVIYTSTNRKLPIIVTFDKIKKIHKVWGYHNHPLREFKCDDNDNFDLETVDYDNDEFLKKLQKTQVISILFLEKIWSEEEQASDNQPADHVFIVNSKSESGILCFFQKSKQIVIGISIGNMLKHKKIKKVFSIDAISAQPIKSLRYPFYDLLILSPNNEIYLWFGMYDERLKCTMPEDYQGEITRKNEQYSGKRRRNNSITSEDGLNSLQRSKSWLPPLFYSKELKIVNIIDPVDNKVNLVYSNGTVVRVLLDLSYYSYLVNNCIKALSITLPYNEYYEILVHLIMATFGGNNHPLYLEEDEWDIFMIIILSFCIPSVNKYRRKQSASEKINEIKNNSFDLMLISSYHRSYKKQQYMKIFTKTLEEEKKIVENDQQESNPKFKSIKSTPITSQYFKFYFLYEKAKVFHSKIKDSKIDLTPRLPIILYTLHLLYEDMKLNILNKKYVKPLGTFLCHIACCIDWQNYYEYYLREGINFQKKIYKLKSKSLELINSEIESNDNIKYLMKNPPSIFKWSYKLIKDKINEPFPSPFEIPSIFKVEKCIHLKISTRSICLQTTRITKYLKLLITDKEKIILEMVNDGFLLDEIFCLPVGIQLPFMETIETYRKSPPNNWPPEAYVLINRSDLAEMFYGVKSGTNNIIPSKTKINNKDDIHNICVEASKKDDDSKIINNSRLDIINMKFNKDNRIEEVNKLLQSSEPVQHYIENNSDLGINDTEQYILLQAFSSRTLSLPVGRGIFNYGTVFPVSNKKYPIPGIDITVRIFPLNTILDINQLIESNPNLPPVPPDLMEWPDFHDGVAAGLQISTDYNEVDSAWILYNRPEELNNQHAGLLLALGLNGHLKKMVTWNSFVYLTEKHVMTSIALLLGLAVANIGSMDLVVTRLLSIHIPALLPPQSTEPNMPINTRIACIMGIGWLYIGSCHRRMAEVMLGEIEKVFESQNELNNNAVSESYSLTAGFALGLITLGQGDSDNAVCLSDLDIANKLRLFIRSRSPSSSAIIALGLMYLKTNNKMVASYLDLPNKNFSLDSVRADYLLLLVLAKNIIMWDFIEPTEEWIKSQIPEFIIDTLEKINQNEKLLTPSLKQAYFNIIAGACFTISLRFAGSANQIAYNSLMKYFDMLMTYSNASANTYSEKLNRTIARSCLDVISVSLSVLMAGSGNLDLLRKLRKLHGKVSSDIGYGSHMACHMAIGFLFLGGGTYTLGTSNKAIAALICSLYPKYPTTVIDNRSHLQAFRHLWVLAVEHRCLITRNINDKNICPVPITITVYDDITRYDIPNVNNDTPTKDIKMITPCILPEFDMIKAIKIDNPRYWPITLNFLENPKCLERIKETQTIIVNRKTGHLDYNKDPKGNKSILCRTFSNLMSSKYKKNSQKKKFFKDFLSSFNEDPIILSYAKIICNYYELPIDNINDTEKIKMINDESKKLSDFFSTILYKCISTDRLSLLPIYSSVYIIYNNFFDKGSSYDIWNLKLIIAYYYNNINVISNSSEYINNEYLDDISKKHLEANIVSQFYLQLDLFFMNSQINDDISDNLINKGDQEYKNIESTLPKKENYRYVINKVIPNFEKKLKSFLLLQTSEMDNNNEILTEKDISFIGSYLNYHSIPFLEELYRLRDLFESYQSEIDNPNMSDNASFSDTSSSNDLNLLGNNSHKVEAFFYVVMSNPHLNSAAYQIIKDIL
ncbi:hypothetical protein LY90DRAFT_677505 [Neocallimastix californiae]|uniref:Uncharacterized protein n=1 Tax=Neocallimastix californiae TaxID=1754190 RepID=A0A1Y1ZZV4_9FUNG|nr:hypothetical protein LY90DRAFT_677505 [Neocallimastix californiae]|eukprot:ORY15789.1 hypothetical protein LY90DRAFT_677505 [Neocallimastix californiae]